MGQRQQLHDLYVQNLSANELSELLVERLTDDEVKSLIQSFNREDDE